MRSTGSQQQLIRRVSRNVRTVIIGSAFAKLCLVTVEFCFAMALGAAGYGLFSIAFALLLVVSTFTQLGFNFGIVQYLSIYAETQDTAARNSIARVSILLVVVVSAIVAAAIYLGADWIASTVFSKPSLAPLFSVVALIIPLQSINHCLSAIFRGSRRFSEHILVSDLVRNLVLLTCLPFVLLGHITLESIFIIIAVGTALATLVGFLQLRKSVDLLADFDRDQEILRQLFSFSYLLFLWQVLQGFAHRLTVFISGAFLPAIDVGILALAMRFLNLLNFPQSVVNTITPVEFALLNHRGDTRGLNRLFQTISTFLLVVSLLIAAPLVINNSLVMSLFGNDYASFGWVLVVLLVATLIDVGSGPAGQVLIACRRRKTVLVISVIDFALQFALVVPCMLVFGLIGAVWGNAIRVLLVVSSRHIALWKGLSVHSITPRLGAIFLVGIALIAATTLFTSTAQNYYLGILMSACLLALFGLPMVLYLSRYVRPATSRGHYDESRRP